MKKKSIYALISLFLMSCQYPELESGLYADIETNKGSIIVSLEFEKTPITVANFVSLSEGDNEMVSDQYKDKKFYDGIIFHRVIDNFMIHMNYIWTMIARENYNCSNSRFDVIETYHFSTYSIW